ncbi:hypothetical protein BH09SUM1_BH09SUM1_11020 [soil metagenome]
MMSSETDKTPFGFFGLLWRLMLCAAIVLPLSAAGGYFAVKKLVQTPELQAPDLLTLPVAEAVDRASAQGFPVFLEKKEPTDLMAAGKILSQRPAPGAWVKEGSSIRMTVAQKP